LFNFSEYFNFDYQNSTKHNSLSNRKQHNKHHGVPVEFPSEVPVPTSL